MDNLLAKFKLDGDSIEVYRELNKELRVCRSNHCVIIPRASGQVTLDLLSLILEPHGEVIEEQDENT